jgi:hypothetical protein
VSLHASLTVHHRNVLRAYWPLNCLCAWIRIDWYVSVGVTICTSRIAKHRATKSGHICILLHTSRTGAWLLYIVTLKGMRAVVFAIGDQLVHLEMANYSETCGV